MGVPKFFRWVSDRYPSILSGPLNAQDGGVPVDNLYLDMNGVIHESARADPNVTGEELFESILRNVFAEVRRIFDIVQPQRLIFIAVDGVAPRAKLNQQRARRFRSSKERIKAMHDAGLATSFDSNCITPGTEFMTRLSVALKAFIAHMMTTDPLWRKLKIHFSGSEVPGEGEHKIISYIRDAKQLPDYAPNLRHCILGADADMIMLALATHEPYFLVLRDAINFNRGNRDNKPGGRGGGGRSGHAHHPGGHADASAQGGAAAVGAPAHRGKVMNYIRINVLRECLAAELLEDLNAAEYDIERLLDDFVFLTFLVGNDFLPSLPAINIGDQAFELIFDAYKTVLASEPGYLVQDGELDVVRLELIFALIGVTEKSMFYDQQLMLELKIKQAEERRAKYAALRAQRQQQLEAAAGHESAAAVAAVAAVASQEEAVASVEDSPLATPESEEVSSVGGDGVHFESPVAASGMSAATLVDREEECKRAYYRDKFDIDIHAEEGQAALRQIVAAYLTGLRWCLRYYSAGCSSWSWYYPYHYGPFLQDMVDLKSVPAFSTIPLGGPLLPFQQLLACLPSASCELLPSPYHALMCDASSPLVHIYPESFDTDKNGKKQEYEAVVILPFIDTAQLLAAEAQYCPASRLSAEERARNSFGVSYIYIARQATAVSVSVDATELTPSFAPGVCFAAALVPGTMPASVSMPGYPSKTQLEEVVNYTKGYGKSKAAKKNQRTRANCYGDGADDGTAGAFPMPGAVTSGVGLGDRSSPEGADRSPAVPSAAARTSSAGAAVRSEHTLQLRLETDSRTGAFLQAVAVQVAAQSPFFEPEESLTDAATAHVVFPLSEVAGTHAAACRELLVSGDALSKAGAIFGPVRDVLQPVGLLSMTGAVSVTFVDTSHLSQLEEFLCQRVFGNDVLDTLCALSSAASGPQKAVRAGSGGGLHGSGVGFARQIVIGTYTGGDPDSFLSWFNKELYKMEKFLPSFSCSRLDVVEHFEDDSQEVLNTVALIG